MALDVRSYAVGGGYFDVSLNLVYEWWCRFWYRILGHEAFFWRIHFPYPGP